MSNWGDDEARGLRGKQDAYLVRDGYPPWFGMTPIQRYEYHTLFCRNTRSGAVIFESFLNTEIKLYGGKK